MKLKRIYKLNTNDTDLIFVSKNFQSRCFSWAKILVMSGDSSCKVENVVQRNINEYVAQLNDDDNRDFIKNVGALWLIQEAREMKNAIGGGEIQMKNKFKKQ